MRVVRYNKLEEIPLTVWDSLVGRSNGSIFQSCGWHRSILKAYGEGDGLCLLGVYNVEDCIGIAPLYFDRKGSLRVLRFIGDIRSDYCDFIYPSGGAEVIKGVFEWMETNRDLWDETELINIPSESESWRILQREVKEVGWKLFRFSPMPCPSLVLQGHGDFVEKVLNKKSLRRHTRYFADQAGFEVRNTIDNAAVLGQLNAFFAQHIQRWSGRETQSLFIKRENRVFYRALLEEASLEGRILFTEVISSGARVATHFGLLDRGKLLWYKPAFDVLLARFYPGEVLLRELVLYARQQGLDELDFTRGDELFKNRFANIIRYNYSCIITRDVNRVWRLWIKGLVKKTPLLGRVYSFLMDIKELVFVVLKRNAIIRDLRDLSKDCREHKDHYDQPKAVRQYNQDAGLQKPEAEILALLRPELKTMSVLDIGVGTGRTSVYFATAAREYRGFDFSPAMVRASRERVGDLVSSERFFEGDARQMISLADHCFDLVLMSFNALDCVNKLDRHLVLMEVRRVAKKGAWFCFSSHNLQSLSMRGPGGAGAFLRRIARYLLLSGANPELGSMIRKNTAMIKDVSGNYQLPLYYITPEAQVDQLMKSGFRDVRIFSLSSGKEVKGAENWARMHEGWVYYLCRV